MDNREYIKSQEPTFLIKAKKTGYICPICGNGSGSDGDGIAKHRGTDYYKCFKCGFYGDVIDLYGEATHIEDKRERFIACAEYYGVKWESPSKPRYFPVPTTQTQPCPTAQTQPCPTDSDRSEPEQEATENFSAFYEQAMQNNDYTYLEGRGIGKEIQKKFRIGYISEWRNPVAVRKVSEMGGNPGNILPTPRCIIPRSNFGYLARDTRKEIPEEQKKYIKQVQGKVGFFACEALTESEAVFVVEGEIDAMSIYEVGGHAVALCSTANLHAFIKYLESKPTNAVLILMLDNDEAGRKAQSELAKSLTEMGKAFIEAEYTAHDPNDQLCEDRAVLEQLVEAAVKRATEKKKESGIYRFNVAEQLDYFRGIESRPPELEAKTGFQHLDNPNTNLQGGLHKGLYVIGAISALGKTTFCLQMADQIAENGHDVIFFSMEQSKYELMAKSISRYTYRENRDKCNENGQPLAKDALQISDSRKYAAYTQKEKNAIAQAIDSYAISAKRMYIYEGRYNGERLKVTTMRRIVRQHIETTGNLPVVFADYLQIIEPEENGKNDKQNIDAAILALKELSCDFGIPVVVISSFNRDNYQEPVSMVSFKESGAVEYSSDVLFGLQYCGMDYIAGESEKIRKDRLEQLTRENQQRKTDRQPIDIELKCLKNRNGTTFTILFHFLSCYNYYVEEKTANWQGSVSDFR